MFMMVFFYFYNLLFFLQKYLLVYCFIQQLWKFYILLAVEFLFKYILLMFIVIKSLLDKVFVLMQYENCNSSVIIVIEGQQKFVVFFDNVINNGSIFIYVLGWLYMYIVEYQYFEYQYFKYFVYVKII